MLTNNFYGILAALMMPLPDSQSATGIVPIKNTSGTTIYATSRPTSSQYPVPKPVDVKKSYSPGIVLGSGTTPATKNDFRLASLVTSGFDAAVVHSHSLENGVLVKNYDITITNTGDNSIQVGEIGICVPAGRSTALNGYTGSYEAVMIDRTVLSTPVTIAAGENETIRYTTRIGYDEVS